MFALYINNNALLVNKFVNNRAARQLGSSWLFIRCVEVGLGYSCALNSAS